MSWPSPPGACPVVRCGAADPALLTACIGVPALLGPLGARFLVGTIRKGPEELAAVLGPSVGLRLSDDIW